MSNEMGTADALVILTRIKAYHSPQSDDDATCEAWADALNYGGVTNVRDAVMAVVRHYNTQGANPFIIPGDVIAGYQDIREARQVNIGDGDLTEDVDPYDTRACNATLRARRRAIGDGMPLDQVKALPLPAEARHALVDRRERPVILARQS